MKQFIFLCCMLVGIASQAQTLSGTASYYAKKFNGRRTASGAVFSNQGMTAACNRLPLGTKVRVTNKRNGKSVVVVINDRIGAHRLIDLTERAARELGFVNAGLTQVTVEVLEKGGSKKNKKKENEEPQSEPVITDTLNVIPENNPIVDSVRK